MKLLYRYLLFIFIFQSQLYAQDSDDIVVDSQEREIDSLFKLTKKAFGLIQKSKHSEVFKISNEILEYEKNHKNVYLRGKVYNLLAISYSSLKEMKKSETYFIKSSDLYKKVKDSARLLNSYNNLGVFYRDYSNDINKSNKYFNLANDLAKFAKNLDLTIHPTYNIGINYYDKALKTNDSKTFRKSLEYFSKTVQLINESDSETKQYLKSSVYNNMSTAYFNLKEFKKSEEYLEKALKFSKEQENLKAQYGIYGDRANLLESTGDYRGSNKMLRELIVVTDSIHKTQKYAEAKAIESQYFIKENEEQLKFVEKEKEIQAVIISKIRVYNIVLALFSAMLLFGVYYIFKKNKELKIARDKAEHLSKAKSNFYSEISHELRTPLYAVIELSKLLLHENVNSKHQEYLESLNFSGSHLMSLINNVLELNKVESGTMKLQSLDFNLKSLITNIIDSLEFALRDSNNKIYLDIDSNIPESLTGDSLKLSQVFINLISNAIKFTNNGRIDVKAKLIEDCDDGVKILFQVKDDGLGISKEKQIQIFEDFYQEHTKSENSYKGTGLGLSIVKRILEVMKSEITIESAENEGSAFKFELIFSKNNKESGKDEVYTNLVKAIENNHILVVDDNKINQLVTRKILSQFNITSKVVDSGQKAIKLIQEEAFDCVLMDLHMPELDGYETTEMIREFNKTLPIIALTASSIEEVEAKLNNYDMNGHVMKPFVTNDFIETIYKAIVKA